MILLRSEELQMASAVVIQQFMPQQQDPDDNNGGMSTKTSVDSISAKTAMPSGETISMTAASDYEFYVMRCVGIEPFQIPHYM